jgi:hypothetical protein
MNETAGGNSAQGTLHANSRYAIDKTSVPFCLANQLYISNTIAINTASCPTPGAVQTLDPNLRSGLQSTAVRVAIQGVRAIVRDIQASCMQHWPWPRDLEREHER